MKRRRLMAAVVAGAVVAGVSGWGGTAAWGQQQQAEKPAAVKKKKAKAPAAPRTPESAVTPEPHSPERHEQFVKEKLAGGAFDLVFIGDSITDFWPKRGAESWAKFAAYRPLDLGVSGDRTEHVLWRINHNELESIHPHAAVIMIGTNNIGQCPDERPEWAAAGVKKVLDRVHEEMPGTRVLLLGVFPRDEAGSEKRQKVEEINKIISQYGSERDTTYLDIGKVFLDDKGEIPADVMPDKLHPSAKGYELWYEAMWPTLEKLLNEK